MMDNNTGLVEETHSLIKKDIRYLHYSYNWKDSELDSWTIKPWRLNLQLLLNCNHRCRSCNIPASDVKKIQADEWLDIVRAYPFLDGIGTVAITGGEPTLMPGLMGFIKALKDAGIKNIGMSSNVSTIKNKQDAYELIKSGLSSITVSYHGIGRHDRHTRVNGSEDRTRMAIKLLREVSNEENIKFRILVGMLVTEKTIHETEAMLDFCETNDAQLFPQLPDNNIPIFSGSGISEISTYSRREVDNYTNDLYAYLKAGRNLSLWERNIPFIRAYLNRDRLDSPCPMAYEDIYVGANGDVYAGCWVLPKVGNLKLSSWDEILSSEAYSDRKKQVFHRECPGCSCGYRQMSCYYLPYVLQGSVISD